MYSLARQRRSFGDGVRCPSFWSGSSQGSRLAAGRGGEKGMDGSGWGGVWEVRVSTCANQKGTERPTEGG